MLSFVQNWLTPRCNPIGIDFGSDSLRLAQVHWTGDEHKLIAAASADVPSHVRNNLPARIAFFSDTVRDLLAQGNFKGRAAVLALPAASMFIQHLRMPKLDEENLAKALVWEPRGKLPIDPTQALMRHIIAGDIYQDQEPKQEVIVMAAAREMVNQFLAAAARAKLDIVGMNVEPSAALDCFSHVYRRKMDAEVTNCFIDIGCGSTRTFITRGGQILFARVIPVGGDHFTRAVAAELKIPFDEAKLLRVKLCQALPALDEHREKQEIRPAAAAAPAPSEENSFALLNAALGQSGAAKPQAAESATAVAEAPRPSPAAVAATDTPTNELLRKAAMVEQACAEPLSKMIGELDLCRRYFEGTFPNKPVERLVFIGGEARQRGLCAHVAQQLGLAAQVGDPMVRMGRVSEIGIESGIDRRQPQPNWAEAIGLSMGPMAPAEPKGRS